MLAELKNNITMSIGNSINEIDFNDLIPTSNIKESDLDAIMECSELRNYSVGMDTLPEDTFNEILDYCLEHRKFREAFWFTCMANFGIRYSDVCKFRRMDFIDENNNFRDRIFIQEKKTSKPRMCYVNNAVKMALLMHLWNGNFNYNDYLIYSEANRKGYETEMCPDNPRKALKVDGKIVYKLDSYGNKIPKPLTREREEQIMKKILIDELNIPLLNDIKTRANGNIKFCTHSIRKLYGNKIDEMFLHTYELNSMAAHSAAMSFLQWDYGHANGDCTTRYIKDYDRMKQKFNLQMNLGYDVLEKYFPIEKERYLNGGNLK